MEDLFNHIKPDGGDLGTDYGIDYRLQRVVPLCEVTSEYYYSLLNCTNDKERTVRIGEIMEHCPEVTTDLKAHPLRVLGTQVFDGEVVGALLYDTELGCIYPITDSIVLRQVNTGLLKTIIANYLIELRKQNN